VVLLSIVIIGRNEAENIGRLAISIDALKSHCDFPVETIFIDSASEDDSVMQARKHFDQVHEILKAPDMCASAGRYFGTNKSNYPWIFYIDADMEICPEFFSVIVGLSDVPADSVGLIGQYVHRFHDGTTAIQTFEGDVFRSEWAASFGGAVILRRDAVLQAGNWNPGVYGKEEMNLYSRLGEGKRVVRYVPEPMIFHYSESYTRVELFKRLLYPSAGQGKVFYGYGQSVRALLRAGKLGALVRLEPEPYIVWLLLISGIACAAFLPFGWGVLLLAVGILLLSVWMRPGPLIRYLTLPLQVLTGWNRYSPDYRPAVKPGNKDNNQSPN
jgi:glycosyltransferase involved in cell wall biosynthesis